MGSRISRLVQPRSVRSFTAIMKALTEVFIEKFSISVETLCISLCSTLSSAAEALVSVNRAPSFP